MTKQTSKMGGGVAANSALREALQQACSENGLILLVAPKSLCTDNAVMVASLA
jgi:tRNA A37 threonylcarbamoyltransferase TsaD